MQLKNVELPGKLITLQPLSINHVEDLILAASDGELWNLWFTSVPQPVSMQAYVETALAALNSNRALPYVVVENSTGNIIGCTRYCNVEHSDSRLEIGYTWYRKSVQRTGVNTECKYLLLKHAFETFKVNAVEFRTHFMNLASRKAIARLGAKQDGILRNHKVMPDGSLRDTVVFSIVSSEWPAVNNNLQFMMRR